MAAKIHPVRVTGGVADAARDLRVDFLKILKPVRARSKNYREPP